MCLALFHWVANIDLKWFHSCWFVGINVGRVVQWLNRQYKCLNEKWDAIFIFGSQVIAIKSSHNAKEKPSPSLF